MRDLINLVESLADDVPVGTIISAKKGGDFDEVTHYFIRDPNGFRRLSALGPRAFVPHEDHLADLDGYRDASLLFPAPKPGEKLFSSIQMLGFPEGTTFLTLSGKPVVRRGDQGEFEGKLFDLKYIEEIKLAPLEESDGEPIVIKLGKKPPSEGVEGFMCEFEALTYHHPLDRTARLLSNASVTVRRWNDGVHINDIMSLEVGQGGGREALEFLCELADKHNVKLTLTAKEYGTRKTLNTKALRDWYARYGFVAKRGNTRDGYDMERQPHA